MFLLYNKDKVFELIRILKYEKFEESEYKLAFEDLCIRFSNKFINKDGESLLENIKNENLDEFNIVVKKTWEIVKKQILNKESLLSYKFDAATNLYKAK